MPFFPRHPAAVWAKSAELSQGDVDCLTTVMLKILDGKCQMNEEQRHAYIAMYDICKSRPGRVFGEAMHELIQTARSVNRQDIRDAIHEKRVEAEAMIPKPVMKAFKARVRDSLATLSMKEAV